MQIVIDIPNRMYKIIQNKTLNIMDAEILEKAVIKNGIPLPKGHGELVDRNVINERYDSIYSEALNCSNQPSDKYLLDKLSMCLDTALPIIEAESEE